MLSEHTHKFLVNVGSFDFQARKYGYIVEVCEPDTAWRLEASQLAKYDHFVISTKDVLLLPQLVC